MLGKKPDVRRTVDALALLHKQCLSYCGYFSSYLTATEPAKESTMSTASATMMMTRPTSLIAKRSRAQTPSRSVDGLLITTSRMPRSMLEDRSKVSKHAKLLQKNGSHKITVE